MNFENRYPLDKKMIIAFYRHGVFPTYKILGSILIVLGGIQLLTVLAGIFGWIESTLSSGARLVFFDLSILVIALGGLLLLYPVIVGKIAYRRRKKEEGEQWIKFGKTIRFTHFGMEREYRYKEIKKIKRFKGGYVITFSKMEGCVVKKGAFCKGHEDEFFTYITKKAKKG